MKKLLTLLAGISTFALASCASTSSVADMSPSTKSQAGGTPSSPSRSSDPRFMTGASGRQDDFTPAAPSPLSLTFEGS